MIRTDPFPTPAPAPASRRWRALHIAFLVAFLPSVFLSAADTGRPALLVFAAASLADALSEIGRDFESAQGVAVRFNFAGSSILARQIASGAPADVFLSADEATMDDVEGRGRLVPGSRIRLLGNQLVLIAPGGSLEPIESFADLASPSVTRIALADPRSVPAGIYARDHLTRLGLWAEVAPKVIPLSNVRSALAAVESGNVDAGIVYRTDAARSSRVRVLVSVPVEEGPQIVYPLARIGRESPNPWAEVFVGALLEPAAATVFQRHGFHVLNPTVVDPPAASPKTP